jgi:Pilus formation protein N terminal region
MSRNLMSNAVRKSAVVVAIAAAFTLAGCGGSGSGNTVNDKPGTALFTSAGSSITVTRGSAAEYSIGGGAEKFVSYSASSNDTKIATVTVEGTKLKITGVSAGEAIITVTDSAGANVKITAKVPGDELGKLAVNAAAEITLTPGLASQYQVTGGAAPYSVTVSNPNVLAAATANGIVSVTAANPGTATVLVFDAAGSSAKFDVTVTGAGYGVALYSTAPESLRMNGKNSTEFTVNGGTGPYVVTTSDAQVATASVNGSKLTIQANAVGRALLNLRDATGTLLVVTVTVAGEVPVPLYSTAPSNVTLNAGGTPTYQIEGGTAPYIASTSNVDVAQAAIVDGNQLQIKGISAGVTEIIVFDRVGASFKVTATVGGGTGTVPLYSTAPDAITVGIGAEPTYKIAGGAAPYTVTSSNVAVATVTQTLNTFSVKGIAAGQVTVSVRDANGTATNIIVEVR